jgi:hypothetical protein
MKAVGSGVGKPAALLLALVLGAPFARGGEVVVWSPNTCAALAEGEDYSGRSDPNAVVRIFGARNGSFTGQAVVFSKTPIKGPEAGCSDLKLKDGDSRHNAEAKDAAWFAEESGWPERSREMFEAAAAVAAAAGTTGNPKKGE